MKKQILTALMVVSLGFSAKAQIAEVHDAQGALQQALQFMQEFEEMVQQGINKADELRLKVEERTEKYQEVKEEMEDIVALSKKIVVLYKEIEDCSTKLENLRKNLLKSAYLSTSEKYKIYKAGQNVVNEILNKKSDIDKAVKKCQTFSRNESAERKDKRLDELIQMVRDTSAELDKIENIAKAIIAEKKEIIENQYQITNFLSIKLY